MVRVAIDVNAKAYAAVKLDQQLRSVLVAVWLWTQLLAHSLLVCLLVERQEARPDAKTRRRTASVVSGVHMMQ